MVGLQSKFQSLNANMVPTDHDHDRSFSSCLGVFKDLSIVFSTIDQLTQKEQQLTIQIRYKGNNHFVLSGVARKCISSCIKAIIFIFHGQYLCDGVSVCAWVGVFNYDKNVYIFL